VKDIFGLKVTHDGRIAEVRARLLESLTEPEEDRPAGERKSAVQPSRPDAKPAAQGRSRGAAKTKSGSGGKGKASPAAKSSRKRSTGRRPRGTAG
jgi:hypothetical protein